MLQVLSLTVVIKNAAARKCPRVKRNISARTHNDLSLSKGPSINLVYTIRAAHQTRLGKRCYRKPQY